MTEITKHHEAIALIGSGIEGIKKAWEIAPPKLDTAELPSLYTLTGNANYDEELEGDDSLYLTRIYRVQVAVIPTGQGDPYTRESLCNPLLEAVAEAYNVRPSLGSTTWVQKSKVLSDSGIVVLPEYGAKFMGFEIRLQVQYIMPREYAPGE